MSYDILKDAMIKYQKAVKDAKTKYFSDLIRKVPNNPKVLFRIIDSVLNPTTLIFLELVFCLQTLSLIISSHPH